MLNRELPVNGKGRGNLQHISHSKEYLSPVTKTNGKKISVQHCNVGQRHHIPCSRSIQSVPVIRERDGPGGLKAGSQWWGTRHIAEHMQIPRGSCIPPQSSPFLCPVTSDLTPTSNNLEDPPAQTGVAALFPHDTSGLLSLLDLHRHILIATFPRTPRNSSHVGFPPRHSCVHTPCLPPSQHTATHTPSRRHSQCRQSLPMPA